MHDVLWVKLRWIWTLAVLLLATHVCGCKDNPVSPPPGPQESGWFWQNPLPQGNLLWGVSFTDANTGTAVGFGGTILRTTTGGVE